MNFAGIDKCEMCNGIDIGVSLYVQGCDSHCPGCFNPETWDLDGGKAWIASDYIEFLQAVDKPYIKRVTILGGEPLHHRNISAVAQIIADIKMWFPEKKIWVYTGYTWDDIVRFAGEDSLYGDPLRTILWSIDCLVDGRFILSERDLTLPFRGSSNQRLIDIEATMKTGRVITMDGG